MWRILYRLLFTRDDDLDLLQLMFLLAIVYFFVAFALAGAGHWSITAAAWSVFAGIFATLAITGTPRWIAELLAKSRNPSSMARAIESEDDYPMISPLRYRDVRDPDAPE